MSGTAAMEPNLCPPEGASSGSVVLDHLMSEAVIDRLLAFSRDYREAYETASPFHYVVIDDFFPPECLRAVLDQFPDLTHPRWKLREDANELKRSNSNIIWMPPAARDLLLFLNSAPVLIFLERLTGIPCLLPDPYYVGGGLHQLDRGGFLDIHADFNRHPNGMDRRLNLILYLNPDWKEEYGGALELWDPSMTTCGAKVQPLFNRCLIFNTTDESFHGHPDPLTCPTEVSRRSAAVYYYTQGDPSRPAPDSHSSVYKARPGDAPRGGSARPSSLKATLRAITPPALWDLGERLRRRDGRR